LQRELRVSKNGNMSIREKGGDTLCRERKTKYKKRKKRMPAKD